jgi:hypothetical protein
MTRQARETYSLEVGRMHHRAAAWLAWILWALCVALFAATVMFLSESIPIPKQEEAPEALTVLLRAMALTYPTVGAFIASRRPGNAIGWILCGTGLLTSVRAFAMAYTQYGVDGPPGSMPGMEYAAWISIAIGVPGVFLAAALLLMVFPDGRLLDRAWWAVVWMAVGGAALLSLTWGASPDPWIVHPSIDNPFRVTKSFYHEVLEPLGGLGFALLLISLVCGGVALLIRVDKGSRIERQQITWLAFLAALMLLSFALINAGEWLVFVGIAAFNCFPIGVGIAVMRYRLLDIDVIINRTLVYGSLTATLVALYFGSIVVLQNIFVVLTGQQYTLAVVASTLAIAALFNPLRRRVQAFVDRRFYRRKYDARKTLEAFSAKLRDETDLEALNENLVGVVTETMQPAHVSLWLRSSGLDRGRTARG